MTLCQLNPPSTILGSRDQTVVSYLTVPPCSICYLIAKKMEAIEENNSAASEIIEFSARKNNFCPSGTTFSTFGFASFLLITLQTVINIVTGKNRQGFFCAQISKNEFLVFSSKYFLSFQCQTTTITTTIISKYNCALEFMNCLYFPKVETV